MNKLKKLQVLSSDSEEIFLQKKEGEEKQEEIEKEKNNEKKENEKEKEKKQEEEGEEESEQELLKETQRIKNKPKIKMLDQQKVPKFIIDLDLPTNKRWDKVIDAYKNDFGVILDYVKTILNSYFGKIFGSVIGTIAEKLFASLVGTGAVYYGKELRSIAKKSGFPLGKLFLLNIAYELCAFCTSIVGKGEEGLILGRTMDWEMPFLKKFTIELEFRRDGKKLYEATSWAGYVGVLTGSRPGVGAVSINYRIANRGTIVTNLVKGIQKYWPISFLVRDCLENCTSYSDLKTRLRDSPLMAPCYITLCGIEDACLITRNRNSEEKNSIWNYNEKGVIIQCNMDHWRTEPKYDIFFSRTRRKLARRLIENLEKEKFLNEETMWSTLYTQPISNEITIYYTVCNPTTGSYSSRIPLDEIPEIENKY
ncbi:acid amidase [Anaeramoeba flamelloides]|uniref:Acid amidase n=1 Tax=Anaeramoeba flamelloides TaxID=1746091 RepID=A0ABQ8XA99_9EUKA|nr:acid amidase [Anaeramoeba flamelloides]